MPPSVSSISALPGLDPVRPPQPAGKPGEFGKVLEGTIEALDSLQKDASGAVEKFLTGENEELHTTVLAAQKAELAFDLGLQVRNKVVAAYQEIMRMQM